MTEDIDFSRMTPAERELERAKQALREEEAHQAKMKRQSELQLLRTESFTKAKARSQLVADTILKNLRLSLVVGGEVRVGSFQAGLVNEAGVTRGHLWSVHGPGCGHLDDVPGGLARVRELFEAVQHPKDLSSFKKMGEISCQRHSANHPSIMSFKGLKLSDLGLEACVCVEGPGHRYKNVSHASLSFPPWSVELGQEFDIPEGGQEIVEAYLKVGYVLDLQAPPKKAKKEKVKPTPEEILEKAVDDWEKAVD